VSVQALTRPRVRRRAGVGDWGVWSVEASGGIARATDVGGVTEVVVADAEPADAVVQSFAALACTLEGGVFVVAHAAPPALLISPRGCRPAPAEPDGRELLQLECDERLLVLSSSVLEAQPTALSRELHRPAGELSLTEPADLLGRLFLEIPNGAGVVLARHPAATKERSTKERSTKERSLP
jgi:hypothetical protein